MHNIQPAAAIFALDRSRGTAFMRVKLPEADSSQYIEAPAMPSTENLHFDSFTLTLNGPEVCFADLPDFRTYNRVVGSHGAAYRITRIVPLIGSETGENTKPTITSAIDFRLTTAVLFAVDEERGVSISHIVMPPDELSIRWSSFTAPTLFKMPVGMEHVSVDLQRHELRLNGPEVYDENFPDPPVARRLVGSQDSACIITRRAGMLRLEEPKYGRQ